jgi:uncharacterized protein YkwD
MGSSGNLHHRDLNAQMQAPGYGGYNTLGENVLSGPRSMTGDQIENAFMNSQPHRDNILSSSYNSVGIGLRFSSDGKIRVTQNFGG